MNDICYEKVMENAGKSQTIIFVHSRKECAKTAKAIRDTALAERPARQVPARGQRLSRDPAVSEAEQCRSADLRDIAAVRLRHPPRRYDARGSHPGRGALRGRARAGARETATLAWGVNLPAHTVIIKGTQMYNPEKGRWDELSMMDVMQMLGRAGRPSYGTRERRRGHHHHAAQRAAVLPVAAQPAAADRVAVRLQARGQPQRGGRARHGPAREAVTWLGYTYLYVRMLRNPSLYGASEADRWRRTRSSSSGGSTHPHRRDAARQVLPRAATSARAASSRRPTSADREPTTTSARTVQVFNEFLKPTLSDIEFLRLFALSTDFAQISVREEEKLELAKLAERVPIPIKESIEEPTAKIEHAAAGVHLAAEARGLRAAVGHGVHHAVGRAADALPPRDRAEARVGGAGRPRAQLLQDGREAHVALRRRRSASSRASPRTSSRRSRRRTSRGSASTTCSRRRSASSSASQRWARASTASCTSSRGSSSARTCSRSRARAARRAHDHARLPVGAQDARHRQPSTSSSRTSTRSTSSTTSSSFSRHKFAEDDHAPHLHRAHLRPAAAAVLRPRRLRPLARRRDHAPRLLPPAHPARQVPAAHGAPRPAAPPRVDLGDGFAPLRFRASRTSTRSRRRPSRRSTTPTTTRSLARPPAAGKTVCAEFAILRMLQAREPKDGACVYMAPSAADRREQARASGRARFAPARRGRRARSPARPRPISSCWSEGRSSSRRRSQWDQLSRRWKQRKNVQSVALLIADELHLIGGERTAPSSKSSSRGCGTSARRPSRPAAHRRLCASLANAKDIGEWIGCAPSGIFNFHSGRAPRAAGAAHPGRRRRRTCRGAPARDGRPRTTRSSQARAVDRPAIVFVPSPSRRSSLSSTCSRLPPRRRASAVPALRARGRRAVPRARLRPGALAHALAYGIGFLHDGLAADERARWSALRVGAPCRCSWRALAVLGAETRVPPTWW